MTERRKDRRSIDQDIVVITWQNGAGCLKQLGTLENVAHNGLGLVVGKALPVMTGITISYGGQQQLAIVRHIEPRDFGYFLGIEFQGDDQMPKIRFWPESLVQEHGTAREELS